METYIICPICKKQHEKNKFSPFCSQRCKDVDLYNWLNGEYSLPMVEPETWSEEKEQV